MQQLFYIVVELKVAFEFGLDWKGYWGLIKGKEDNKLSPIIK